jgi:hypothetical protein
MTLATGPKLIKNFVCNLLLFKYARAFAPGELFQPSVLFAGKARSLPNT